MSVQVALPDVAARLGAYDLKRLLEECTISANTTAAGGSASLMSIG